MSIRLLITGATGQIGWHLQRTLTPLGAVTALTRDQLDLSDLDAVTRAVREFKPDILVNSAAYTAVDKAESEADLARTINALAPARMAEELARIGGVLIHYSTDYVFDGNKPLAESYSENDATGPLNVYGRSKLEGEQLIVASGCPYIILRTTWVYDTRGKNFLRTVLRLAREREELRMVADQYGAPTWARTIAEATTVILARSLERNRETGAWRNGLFHLTAAEQTSWEGFARAILEDYEALLDWAAETGEFGGPLKAKRVAPITSDAISGASAAAAKFGAFQRDGAGGLRDYHARLAKPAAACHAGCNSLIIFEYQIAEQFIFSRAVAARFRGRWPKEPGRFRRTRLRCSWHKNGELMKGIVLAGGIGTRLYPLTRVTNKHLLPVYDKPMIFYPLQTLVDAGIRDILIVTGGQNAGDFLRLLQNGKEFGLQQLSFAYQEGEGGIADALRLAEPWAKGDKICVVLGDNIIEGDMREAARNFEKLDKGAMVMLKEVTDPERFGVPVFENDRIVRIEEKPKKPLSSYAVIGIYFYDGTVFDRIRTLKPSGRGEYEITDINNSYITEGTLQHTLLEGWWTDAGTFESLWHASNMVRDKVLRNAEESATVRSV